MKKVRILSLILALIMLTSCFLFSCGKEEEEGKVGGDLVVDTETLDESKIYDAEIKNLNGHEFHFIARKMGSVQIKTHEIYAEELNGDKINDAVFTRNAQLAEKYNCTITQELTSNVPGAVREPLLAGEYVADYLFAPVKDMRTLAQVSLLQDMAMLDNIDLDKAWWDGENAYSLNLGNKIFFAAGDAATLDDRSCWVMWFNKDFIKEYDDSINLYEEVREGKWTIDRLYQLMTATAKDVDGDGVFLDGNDRMGYIAERGTNWMHICSCNVTVSTVDSAGNYDLPLQPKQELLDVWAELKSLLTSPKREVSFEISNFRNGLGTFFACNLGTALEMGDTPYNIGALPMPKRNEQQDKYYTGGVYSQLSAYAIPMTVNNCEDWETNGFTSGVEQAAYFLEAFAYYSMNILTPAFFDQVVLKQAVRDTDASEMIKMAVENKVFDPVVGYNFAGMNFFGIVGSANQVGGVGTDVNYETLVSTYESRVVAARTSLQNYLKNINIDQIEMD